MLPPNTLRPGALSSAKGLSVLKPLDEYGSTFLIVPQDDGELLAIFLEGDHKFHAFPAKGAEGWSGLFFDEVRVEVDPFSAQASDFRSAAGTLRWNDTGLYLSVIVSGSYPSRTTAIVLTGLPQAENGASAAFPSWRIVTGDAKEPVVIWSHRPTPASA